VFHHCTCCNLSQAFTVQIEALYQSLKSSTEHVHVAGTAVAGVGAHKGDAITAKNGDFTDRCHGEGVLLERKLKIG
jgi:hypothetical protein